MDEERLYLLEQNLKDTTEAAAESEKRYEEVPHFCTLPGIHFATVQWLQLWFDCHLTSIEL